VKEDLFKKLGISRREKEVFGLLSDGQKRTAKEVAVNLRLQVPAAHRLLKRLARICMVVALGKHPVNWQALPLEVGVGNYVSEIGKLAQEAGIKPKLNMSFLPFRIIPNRKEYHKMGERLFNRVKKEVLVIASGTGDLSAEFVGAKFGAVGRGIRYRILAMTQNASNSDKLKNWQKTGFEIRFKEGKGINLVIYDRRLVQLAIRIEEDSKEKMGLLIENKTLAEYLGEFYDFLWKNATVI